jgi:hypothetical protein
MDPREALRQGEKSPSTKPTAAQESVVIREETAGTVAAPEADSA